MPDAAARVTVVLPTHNRPALLAEALASLEAQTYQDWEAWIVDDASAPPVNEMGLSRKIHVLRHTESRGGAASKNAGLQRATGELIAFLDDDDLYAPGLLARAVGVFDRHADLDVVFMGVSWFGPAGNAGQSAYERAMEKVLSDARGQAIEDGAIAFGDDLVEALLKTVPMAFQRPVVRRTALERIGGYRPECLLWDCDWAIRAAMLARVALVLDGLYLQRAAGQGYSSRGDRQREHLKSNIEIKERLAAAAESSAALRRYRIALRHAAAQAWFDMAWYCSRWGKRTEMLRALLASQGWSLNLSRLRLLIRMMLPRDS